MRQLNNYSDDRNKGTCIHCGVELGIENSTRDHVPTRALLNPPYPEHLIPVKVCQPCNAGFSKDEEYLAAFLGSVIYGSTKPDPSLFPRAARTLNHTNRLRERIDRSQTVQGTLWGSAEILWEPELDRVERVIVKNARGHVLNELGEPMLGPPSYVMILPIQRMSVQQQEQFANPPGIAGWPEVGSRSMQRMAIDDLKPGGWIEVQPSTYRYAVHQLSEQTLVRIVLRDYLACEVAWDEARIA